MNEHELENRLREALLVQIDVDRERALLAAVRSAESEVGRARPAFWRRRVPLWQAAAATAALLALDRFWLRRTPETPPTPPALRVRVERDLFASTRTPGEPIDVSKWAQGIAQIP